MAWVATDKDGEMYVYKSNPDRMGYFWDDHDNCGADLISIEAATAIIGKPLTWNDEPVEIKTV